MQKTFFKLVLIIGFTPLFGQQRVPVFALKQDSAAYEKTLERLMSAMRNPMYGFRIDSLRKEEIALREKAVRYRTVYRPSPGYERWGKLTSSLQTAKRVALVDYPGAKLPDSLFLMTGLEELELINTNIRKLPSLLSNLPRLKKISLLNNRPRGRVKLPKLPGVETLVISDDEFDRRPRSYRSLPSLTMLDLSRNNMTRIPKVRHKGIKRLILTENNLTLQNTRLRLPSLEELTLTSNGIKEIPASIASFPKLKKLNLNLNEVTVISPEIGKLKNLEQLSLYKNKVSALPSEIFSLPNLRVIDFYYNQLKELDPRMANWKKLEILYAANNQIVSLPDNLGELVNLRELYLHHNKISNLPASLGGLDSLRVLRVNNNFLVEFPQPLLNLKSLENLDVASNQLTEVPEALFLLPRLKILSLKGNPFEPAVRARLLDQARRAMQERQVMVHLEGLVEPGLN